MELSSTTLWRRRENLRTAPAGGAAWSGVLGPLARWSGEVRLAGDVMVPWGATLEIAAGTRVRAAKVPRWKYRFDRRGDRGAWLGSAREHCYLVVYGTLRVLGTAEKPVRFLAEGAAWGGVVLLDASRAQATHAEIAAAEIAGLACFDRSRLEARGCRFQNCRAGLLCAGLSRVWVGEGAFAGNGAGLLACDLASVEAEGSRFFRNRLGMCGDDASRSRLTGNSFRANRDRGVLARGRCRVELASNAFEGQAEVAVRLEERARLAARDNRLFHNGCGYQLEDDSRLSSRGDKVGPNARCGVQALSRARAAFRDGFFHSHETESAFQTQSRARADLSGCRFFSNWSGVAAHDRSDCRLDRCVFQGNRDSGASFNGWARARVEQCQFSRNASALAFFGSSRGMLAGNDLRGQSGVAVRVAGQGRVRTEGNRWQDNFLGMEIQDSAAVLSRADRVEGQKEHGFLVRQFASLEVRRGCFQENGGAALQGLDNARLTLEGNRLRGNGVGAAVTDGASARIRRNEISGHRQEGVSASSVGRVEVEENVFLGNRVGVGHFGRDRSRVARNRFARNTGAAGLCAAAAAPVWEKNVCQENFRGLECRNQSSPRVTGNRFEDGGEAALRIEEEAAPWVEGNVFRGNRVGWFCADSARPHLEDNDFCDNLTDAVDLRKRDS